jgi:hypothetical protein
MNDNNNGQHSEYPPQRGLVWERNGAATDPTAA